MIADSGRDNLETLLAMRRDLGVDLLSTAAIGDGQRERFHESIREIAGGMPRAIALGIRLAGPVLETVVDAPTWTYYHHYRTVNAALDQAALRVAGWCMERGYRSLPVPASQLLEWDRPRAHLSHREIAFLAGFGWRGRNNLIVHPLYGSQIRFSTVLTDMPLPAQRPVEQSCGSCMRCVGVCPAGAIHEDPDDFDRDRCAAQLRRFAKSEKLNTMICGICIRACGGRRTPKDDE